MERFALAAVLLAVLSAAPAQQAAAELSRRDFTMIDGQTRGMGKLYASYPRIVRDYVAAMDDYRALRLYRNSAGFAYPLIAPSDAATAARSWTWTASNGSAVRRLKSGGFRLTVGEYFGNWFAEVDCRDVGWPVFSCGDGRQRKMSSPDLTILTFDGVEYVRAQP